MCSLILVVYAGRRAVGFRVDDGLIYARYVRNLIGGRGLVFNPGEVHNAITSPLFVWLVAAASLIIPDIPLAANVLGLACIAATVYLATFHLFSRDESPLVGAAAGVLFASANITYLTLGLESSLLLFLATALLVAHRAERRYALAVLAGLCVVTRAETVLLVIPIYASLVYRDRRIPWRESLVTMLVVLPFLGANLALFGGPLPDSLAAKIQQGRSGFWGEGWVFPSGARTILEEWYVGLSVTVVGLALCLPALLRPRRANPVPLIATFVVGLVAFYSAISVPAYHWYLAPVVWAICLSAPLGVATAGRLVARSHARVAAATLGVGLLALAFIAYQHATALRALPDGPDARYLAVAGWLRTHVPADRSLGAAEVGHLGWYTEMTIVDLVGVVSPHNAAFLGRRDVQSWLRLYDPDYILVHAPPWAIEAGAVRESREGRYEVVDAFDQPGFTLLGPPGSRRSPADAREMGPQPTPR